ncbi:diaminopimelate epimerase [Prochlorococcus sp. MIT 0601]|uniref:diaminopimelate epimerase n=1 Tax=Prochlorococcus sp. MIT 0601 TaxID=1499498 RepID=UPI00053371BE|nr:diaminopimelate epimerase [Prochlorococcus sp. MIT 0601]KGG12468.1 Diaminopimelate epimerase [Prochlorococcus sp. MIT 0601]
MEPINFQKYHGIGNDFIIIDGQDSNLPYNITSPKKDFVKKITNRNFGIGADGIILILPSNTNNCNVKMKIFNSDGTEPEMCGNGIRCLVKYILDNTPEKLLDDFKVETLAGDIPIKLDINNNIVVDMGVPILTPPEIPTYLKIGKNGIPQDWLTIGEKSLFVSAISMGNPHAVVEVDQLYDCDINLLGPELEIHPKFPKHTNVHFIKIIRENYIEALVWERGCGTTLACGTGACAIVAILSKLGKCSQNSVVKLPGGELSIHWPQFGESIYMSGSAEYVYKGQLTIS